MLQLAGSSVYTAATIICRFLLAKHKGELACIVGTTYACEHVYYKNAYYYGCVISQTVVNLKEDKTRCQRGSPFKMVYLLKKVP